MGHDIAISLFIIAYPNTSIGISDGEIHINGNCVLLQQSLVSIHLF
ncbi:hypothetical protein HMPREF1568_3357 [Providencia alcalifaciens PAL-3]|nr:hypothetical protein HMPREF1568_3357 [Providencia alcalifaciens PAL-3]EUC99098.1 hypothetical protein HMPREF1566_0817 [Providencia alcalifaciens PAL-1]